MVHKLVNIRHGQKLEQRLPPPAIGLITSLIQLVIIVVTVLGFVPLRPERQVGELLDVLVLQSGVVVDPVPEVVDPDVGAGDAGLTAPLAPRHQPHHVPDI